MPTNGIALDGSFYAFDAGDPNPTIGTTTSAGIAYLFNAPVISTEIFVDANMATSRLADIAKPDSAHDVVIRTP